MYTFRDIVSDNFKLISLFDISKIDEVVSVVIVDKYEERKKVVIRVVPFNYFFNPTLKKMIKDKVRNDLGVGFDLKFGMDI